VTLSRSIARSIYARPGRYLVIVLALTLVFSAGLYNFSMTMDIDDMLPETQEVEDLKQIQEEFFNTEMASFVTKGEPVFSPIYFGEMADVIEAWADDPEIVEVMIGGPETAIVAIPMLISQYDLMQEGNPQPTLDQMLQRMRSYGTQEEIEALVEAYVNDPNIPDLFKQSLLLLLPVDNRDLGIVPTEGAMFVELDGNMTSDHLLDVLLEMESLSKKHTKETEIYMFANGALGHYMTEAEAAMEPIFLVLIIIIFGVLYYAFRRLTDTGITMLSLLIAVLWQIGMISWLGISLDLFQFMVPLLLMGLGVDFSLHLIINYREGLSEKGTNEEKLERAVNRVFKVTVPALLLATVTTMVGFGSNMIFEFAAIFKFGLGATLGILAVLMVNLFFVLPWRVWTDRRKPKNIASGAIKVERIDAEPSKAVRAGYRSLSPSKASVLLAVLVLLAIPGLIIAPTLQGTYDLRDELIEDQDLSIAATALMEDFAMGTEEMYIRVGEDWLSAEAWQRMYESLDVLEGSEYVSKIDDQMVQFWASPLLPAYAALDPALAPLWANVTEDGETVSPQAARADLELLLDAMYSSYPEFSRYVYQENGEYTAMLVTIPTKTSWGKDGLALKEDTDAAFSPSFEDYQATGMALIWGIAFDQMTIYMIQSIIIVVVFAFGFLIAYNSIKRKDPILGIITGIPPIFVLGWMFLTMYLASIPLNLMTSMVGAIVIGLSIDYPIHIVNRWVYETEQGNTLRTVYNITIGSTGREVVFSGITTLLALGTFFLLPMEAMRTFGLMMFIAIFYSILGALLLTPLMLRFWGPKESKEQAT
jgi:predicted RND superfamily exporter protein